MNVLIGYDGSPGSDLALEDLLLAGLPGNVDFTVISVADVWSELISAHSRYDEVYPHSMATARAMASEAMAEAHGHAERGANWLGTHFPSATVRAVAIADSPSRGLVREAEERWADLLVVGSHGRSTFGRLFLGSVSHHAMTFAQCSVRVAHHSDSVVGAPLRLVVGTDGSPGAGAAVRAVAQRNWPQGTAVRVVVAVERPLSLLMPGPHGLGGTRLPENGDDLKAWGFHAAKAAADGLHRAGLSAVPVVREGSPKRVLTEEADEWNADCIFVGAHGLRGSERSAPGSVAIAVGVRSRCTVEVVRAPANVATT
jgi:nucleotide-binding universal stress UspA family protein